MKKFFYSHPDTIIAILALVFLGTLVGFYIWATNDIFSDVHRALTYTPPTASENFDINGAEELDLRGIVNGSTSASAPVHMPPPPASTTASSTGTSTSGDL